MIKSNNLEGNNTLYRKYNEYSHKMTHQEQLEAVRCITYLHQLDGLLTDPDTKEYKKEVEHIIEETRMNVSRILTKYM